MFYCLRLKLHKEIGNWRHVSSAIDMHTQTKKPPVGLSWDCKRKESKIKKYNIEA